MLHVLTQKSRTEHHACGLKSFAARTLHFTLKTCLFCSNRFSNQTKVWFCTCCPSKGDVLRSCRWELARKHVLNRGGSAFGWCRRSNHFFAEHMGFQVLSFFCCSHHYLICLVVGVHVAHALDVSVLHTTFQILTMTTYKSEHVFTNK